ncbi:3-deoxy-D-manno-octulosonic acid transferase [Pararhodobacter sp.]|uniref:3-deoxy-D-manno-octulosonic acid transferase n=1 Tax=Pararhodobacter sp. TaxID=2127056 RepID=UPI002AFF8E7F|nr:glycosyltransferase N-terminal domain-containing protein [Pararhodobacter sp.]
MTASAQERLTVWLHSTDVGLFPVLEVLAEQIADFKAAPDVLLTGSQADKGPDQDDSAAIDQFLEAHSVRVLVLAGAVIPVPLLERAHARGVACLLVDARHPVVPGRWSFLPGKTRATLSRFTQIHTQDAQSAAALSRSVRDKTEVFATGRLARFAPAHSCNAFELDSLRESLGARPVWFAYDLPEGETETALIAHSHALRRAHRLLVILQPRDPGKGEAMAERARAQGFVCARRTLEEEIDESTQVYVADSEDDPGLFLRLAAVSFLGGSLTPEAGTPSAVTAAALGSALVFGPHASPKDRDFLERLCAVGAGRQIGIAPALGEALARLLAPDVGAEAALKAWTLATDGSDATYKVAQAIVDWLQLNRGRP